MESEMSQISLDGFNFPISSQELNNLLQLNSQDDLNISSQEFQQADTAEQSVDFLELNSQQMQDLIPKDAEEEELSPHLIEELFNDMDIDNVPATSDKENPSATDMEVDDEPLAASVGHSPVFQCPNCSKKYRKKKSLNSHVIAKHKERFFPCQICGKVFSRSGDKNIHEKSCTCTENICDICGKKCSTAGRLARHKQVHIGEKRKNKNPPEQKRKKSKTNERNDSQEAGPSNAPSRNQPEPSCNPLIYHCRRCPFTSNNRRDLYLHGMREHYQHGGALHRQPWGDNPAPWEREDGTVDERLQEVYEANEPLILQNHETGPVESNYNFPVTNDVSVDQLMRHVNEIYQDQQHSFRLNLSFGVILQNRETLEYRYFTAYTNNVVFDSPMFITEKDHLEQLKQKLRRMDILYELLHTRPDTKWIPVLVTNVQFFIASTNYLLGVGNVPDYILNKQSIYSLVKNRRNGKLYDDNLCMFRCLALHNGYDIKSVEEPAKKYFQQWIRFNKLSKQFCGVDMEEFPDFETCFKVDLEVYSLQEDDTCHSIYKSRGRHNTSMYINMYENHASYIKNFACYAKKFQCSACAKLFDESCHLHRHQKTCTNKTKFIYPGGFFKSNQTIFEKLEHYDINVPQEDRTFPWFIVYDFEAMLQKVEDNQTPYLKWTQKHVPISVSVCSNVPGYTEPYCIVNPDVDELVSDMVLYMQEIQSQVMELTEEKWGWVLNKLNSGGAAANDDGDDGDDEDDINDKRQKSADQRIGSELKKYMTQVPVLGFNSAKYDINLIKKVLAKHLCLHGKDNFVVKKNNAYMCISNPELKFLDMIQFLAPGTSYAKFLAAYGVQEKKGFFPYEWFDDISKLDHPELPTHEAFYSTLRQTNISSDDYQHCQRVWREQGMTTFRDVLKHYNNLDTGENTFCAAVKRFQDFYFKKGLDVFKTAISVPGVARQMLFKAAKDAGANFALFDKQNEDLYNTFKTNITGGPSLVYTRRQKAGETKIRGGKTCRRILGYDSNALYLWAIDQKMPVGPFIRRKAPNFKPEVRDKYMSAYHWMDFLNQNGAQIQHMLNCGQEKRVGKYPVDGYDVTTNTIYQYHGCWVHSHLCSLTRDIKDKKWWDNREANFKKTQATTEYLRQQGYTVIEMWECNFKEFCRQHPKIYDLINKSRPEFYQRYKYKAVTEEQILQAVVNEQLFGAVEVDIMVPEQWTNNKKQKTNLTPYDYFAEMCPLFCNTDVPFEAIGTHMQQHVEAHNLSKAPRRLLVSGMKARQMLIATPLLKWYLEHGMVVTKIYQVVEYKAQACFQQFVKDVSNARRDGDVHPDKAIIAETNKLVGNSGFGSMIMDKLKHLLVKYVDTENKACLLVNDPQFRRLDCLDLENQYYEAEMAKKKIKLDMPIILGYFILQYAKLHMLSFYYDFMDKYVDRSDFEYCEMDTDSAYMAISGPCLNDVIKKEKRQEFEHGLKGFCYDTEIKADEKQHWFPRTCCDTHAKFDKRTPGLFKLEYEGDEIIGLCSKTYIVRKTIIKIPSAADLMAYKLLRKAKKLKVKRLNKKPRITSECKFSSKGVSKKNVKAPMSIFRHVIKTGASRSSINRGFRAKDNTIFTYAQQKRGFSYFYCKRKVLDDGIHTVPLDITLCPVPQTERREEDKISDDEVTAALLSLLDEQ